jgi:acetyltransferase-like isoleucine patch superfamily enzyme
MQALIKLLRRVRTFVWSSIANTSHHGANRVCANGFTWLSKNTCIGNNVNCNGMQVYGAGHVVIGDNFHSGRRVAFYTQSHNYHGDAVPYDRTIRLYHIKIGDNVWFGDNVTVVGNVEIGEGAIIQVGSVVSRNIGALEIAGGNPAKAFKKRDPEHYFRVKATGKFH